MKGVFNLSLLATAAMLLGCGGSGSSSNNSAIDPGYYRGTFNVTSDGWINGAAPMFIDLVSQTEFTGEALSDTYYVTVSNTAEGAWLNDGTIVQGDVTVTKTVAGFDFTFTNGSSVTASGQLSAAVLPALGSAASVPEAGNWEGELLVVSQGRAKSFGTVTATIDSSGNLTALTRGGRQFVNDGIFSGKFESDGTLSGATLFAAGQIYTQSPAPVYSNDGTTIIARFDKLALDNASCWLTLTQSQPEK